MMERHNEHSVVRVLESIGCAELRVHEYLKDVPHRIFYRGVANHNYQLIPGLMREVKAGGKVLADTLLPYEKEIVESVECEYFEELHDYTFMEKLIWLQHYGFPTRLLDVTRNKLVALYFAALGSHEITDGAVYVIGIPESQILSVQDVKQSYKSGDPKLLRSPTLTERQRRQSGEFLLMSNKRYSWNKEPASGSVRPDLMSDGGIVVEGKIIQAGIKAKVLSELSNGYGITSHFLFPEDPSVYRKELVGSIVSKAD